MSLELTGTQLKGLQQALLSAFPNMGDLEQMMLFEMNESLAGIVATGPLTKVTLDLIVWAKAKGRLEEFIVAACTTNPGNPDLKAFAAEILGYAAALPKAGGQLEAMVVADLPFVDVAEFRKKMRDVESATCMVEDGTGKGWGTGFLVGPDVIMTNHHVLGHLRSATPQVRFGYIRNTGGPGADDGVVVKMKDADWELISSPSDDLDFALLRLSENASALKVDGVDRGFLKPEVAYTFKIDEPILIVQHPQREPMKFGAGYLKDVNALMKRIAYTTNTETGSSGSPCFNQSWDLVALHHHGDQFTNHGTPMKYIFNHLTDQGKTDLIG